jgi:DNA-binding GntR family transcriptional regulator
MTTRASTTIAELVFEQLRDDLTSNKFRPGDRLKFTDMQKRYSVGVGPLREALFRLVGVGLVTQVGQKGFRAAAATEGDLAHIIATRKFLEERALLDSLAHGDDEWENGVVSAFHQLSKATRRKPASEDDYRSWEKLHKGFHFALVRGCGSAWLLNAWEATFDQAERYRRLAVQRGHWLLEQKADHEKLMRAAIARDTRAASAILGRHIGQSGRTRH